MNVQGSIVFVTGANRGMGLAFAREAQSRGAAKVYAGVRNTAGFNVPGIVPVKIDVTDPATVRASAARCGDTTLLVNNAGIGRLMTDPLDGKMDELAREVFETNFYGLIRVTQAFAPILAENDGGAIINVLSDVTWIHPHSDPQQTRAHALPRRVRRPCARRKRVRCPVPVRGRHVYWSFRTVLPPSPSPMRSSCLIHSSLARRPSAAASLGAGSSAVGKVRRSTLAVASAPGAASVRVGQITSR